VEWAEAGYAETMIGSALIDYSDIYRRIATTTNCIEGTPSSIWRTKAVRQANSRVEYLLVRSSSQTPSPAPSINHLLRSPHLRIEIITAASARPPTCASEKCTLLQSPSIQSGVDQWRLASSWFLRAIASNRQDLQSQASQTSSPVAPSHLTPQLYSPARIK